MLPILSIVLTYGILGFAASAFLLWLLKDSRLPESLTVLTGFGIAPGLAAYLLYLQYLVIPDRPSWTYVVVSCSIFVALGGLGRSKLRATGTVLWRGLRKLCKRASPPSMILRLFVVGLLALVLYIAIVFPIHTQDALQHAYVGRMLYLDRSLVHYPLLSTLSDGFNFNMRYPPGIHMLYAWSLHLQSAALPDTPIRWVAPYYVVLTTFLLAIEGGRRLGRNAGILGALMLLSVPVYVHQACINSLDAFRIFFLLAVVIWAFESAVASDRRSLLVVGVLAAMCAFTHTLGLIAIPTALLVLLCFSARHAFRHWILAGSVVGGFALFGGLDYVRQIILTGTWRGGTLYIPNDWSQMLTHRGLDSTWNVIFQGMLRPWTNRRAFGPMPWIALLSSFLSLWRRFMDLPRFVRACLLSSAAIAFLIWAAPIQPTGWGNARYIMSVTPFLALIAGHGLSASVARIPKHLLRVSDAQFQILRFVSLGLGVLAVTVAVLLTPALLVKYASPDGVLEPATLLRILSARIILGIAGVLCALGSFILAYSSLRRKIGNWIRLAATSAACVLVCIALCLPSFRMIKGDKGVSLDNLFRARDIFLSTHIKLERLNRGNTGSALFLSQVMRSTDRVLLTDDPAFLYYTQKRGVSWRDLTLKALHDTDSKSEALQILQNEGITYIQVRHSVERDDRFIETQLDEILADPSLVDAVWQSEGDVATTVYRLLGVE